MIAIDLGVENVDQVLRLVRALGAHRYVAGRLHLVHAFAIASAGDDGAGLLDEARAWALPVVGNASLGLDLGSRDERLWRRCSDAELGGVLEAFWFPGARSRAARARLKELVAAHASGADERPLFDESSEESIHPLLVDAGWELVSLRELDPERHKGAMAAFGDALAFEAARFEEETAIPSTPPLYELSALGPAELLGAADDSGHLAQPFVVWSQGNETYLDYLFRGIERAAKLV
ncbi:MAG TPA: hypothetical protein VII82_15250 [Polyangiaceae bacterium]|jgi:hypothetical protein